MVCYTIAATEDTGLGEGDFPHKLVLAEDEVRSIRCYSALALSIELAILQGSFVLLYSCRKQ